MKYKPAMNRMYGYSTLVIMTVAFAFACHSPMASNSTLTPGTIKISFSSGSSAVKSSTRTIKSGTRSVAANWNTTIASYAVSLHCTSASIADLNASGSDSVAFTGVTAGTWTISATALNSASIAVGVGTLTGQVLSAGSSLSVTLPISGTQTGTGNYSFTFEFPLSSTDYASAQLYDLGNTSVGSVIAPTITLDSVTGLSQATVAQTGIASGIYRLELTFRKGGSDGAVVGVYGESVNVWDNVTSNQWLNSSGSYESMRTFAATEFSSTDATLSNISATVDGQTGVLGPSFSSSVTNYLLSTSGTSITLTPVESLVGQRIQYQVNGTEAGGWTDLASGSSAPAAISGDTVNFKVTAPDQQTTRIYAVAIILPGTTNIYISLGSFQSLGFSESSMIVPLGNGFTITPIFSNGSNWQWFVNGALSGTSASFTYTPPAPGLYTIYTTVTNSSTGVLYSGSMTVTSTNVRNLLTNPGWKSGTSPDTTGWSFVGGGSGWNWGDGVFTGEFAAVSSFNWCTHSQTVDLIASGYTAAQLQNAGTVFTFSEYVAGDYIAMSYYFFTLELLDSSDTVLDTVSLGSEGSPLSVSTAAPWSKQTLTYTNTLGKAIAHIRVTGGGKDSLGWVDSYGSWFTHPSLTVTLP
jgi:hypothetical protein